MERAEAQVFIHLPQSQALRDCKNAHNMIELNENQLNGLRKTCSAKAELTQQVS